jgi:hypothetical protein
MAKQTSKMAPAALTPERGEVQAANPVMSAGVAADIHMYGHAFDHEGGAWVRDGDQSTYLPRGTWRMDKAGKVVHSDGE